MNDGRRPLRSKTLTLALGLLLVACSACASKPDGANKQAAPGTAVPDQSPTPLPQSETCRMLSSEDLREVQGEEPQDAQGSEHLSGGLSMSQCLYRLPTFSKSVNIEII